MKKLLLASLITAASFGASAESVITFDDSSFGGTGVTFDFLDFARDPASVIQSDTDGSGDVTGVDAFSETGTARASDFSLAFFDMDINPAYEIFYDYSFIGTALTTITNINPLTGDIEVTFSGGTSSLYIDTVVDQAFDIADLGTTVTELASFTMIAGSTCDIALPSGQGSCFIDLNVDFKDSYFTSGGVDLTTSASAKTALLSVTVQQISSFTPDYDGGAGVQEFQVVHDGNLTFSVPEPTSIAILGLGLLGFAGARRRKA